jgi:FAD:protein FMN transferase
MGTVFSIAIRPRADVAPAAAHFALDRAFAWLHWVDATFSTYRRDSDVSRLVRGEVELAGCAPEVGAVLRRCEELEAETDGYFSAYAAGALDPSGLVKGWAIGAASALLSSAGLGDHCVNGGGDVQCAGSASAGQPWRIGIAHPIERELLAGIVVGTDVGVATSGRAERGQHIVDPHTGSPATGLVSVTVAGPGVATADAYATAAFAMGGSAVDWIATRPGYTALIVFADGRIWSSMAAL